MARRNQYKRARKGAPKRFKSRMSADISHSISGLKGFSPRGGPPTTLSNTFDKVIIKRTFVTTTVAGNQNVQDTDFGFTVGVKYSLVSFKVFAIINVQILTITTTVDESTNNQPLSIVDYYQENHSPKAGVYCPPMLRVWQTVTATPNSLFNVTFTKLDAALASSCICYATFEVQG